MNATKSVPGLPGAVFRRVSSLPETLLGGEAINPRACAMPGQLLFAVPGAGRFLARDGNVIDFVEDADADPGLVELFLQGTARGALIHQRGDLPLHAATLVPPGGKAALAICGASGAGKSTLAIELSRRGWALVADDTTRLTWEDGLVIAWPSRDSIKLWRDACERAGFDCSTLDRVTREMDKYYVIVPAHNRPVPLRAVVELVITEEIGEARTPGEKMALISRNTYRPGHIRPLGKQQDHVRAVARIAAACGMFRLRGGGVLPVTELAETVERMMG